MGTLRPALQRDRSRPIPDRRDERAALPRRARGQCARGNQSDGPPRRDARTRQPCGIPDGTRGRMDQWPDHRHRWRRPGQAHGGNFYGALKDMGDEQWEAMRSTNQGDKAADKAEPASARLRHDATSTAAFWPRERPPGAGAKKYGKWCCWGGLNSRPHPYQGCALPLSYSSTVPPRANAVGVEARANGRRAHKSTFA